ncbi:MAG: hypothetical protein DBX55_01845 [Verrucomicrobia bacterium]|nr:MAG: hypothetical protein DBX55_01845 [Verrucomicrobiota bacterium]
MPRLFCPNCRLGRPPECERPKARLLRRKVFVLRRGFFARLSCEKIFTGAFRTSGFGNARCVARVFRFLLPPSLPN